MGQNNKGGPADMVENRRLAESAAVLVYATFPSSETAAAAGRALLEARLAACINILPAMTSIYRWKGVIESASEAVLLAKLPPQLAKAAVDCIVAAHPYETPAVLVIPVLAGAAAYLDWIRAETAPPEQT